MFVLTGWNRKDGDLEQNFTNNERATAIAIARLWVAKGWKPTLKHYVNGANLVQLYRKAA